MEIRFFSTGIEKFIASLEKYTIAKVLRTIDLLERFGYQLGLPHSKKVVGGIWELRIRGSQEVRLFYTFSRDSVVLLHGFVKKSQRLPLRELEIARKRKKELDSL